MKPIAAFLMSITLLAGQGRDPAQLRVSAVRHWTLTGVTRVAIEVSGEFQYRTDRLHNPERVYFDIPNSQPRIDSRRLYSEALEDPLLRRVRVAETTPGVTRVVLELGDGVEISVSQLTNPNRLIVELKPGAAPGSPAAPQVPLPLEKPPQAAVIFPQPAEPAPARAQLPVKEPDAARQPAGAAPAVERTPTMSSPAPPPRPEPQLKPAASPATAAPLETAKAARRTSAGENSLTRALGLKIGRVVIDPGHGGHDQGTEGPRGLLEKDLVLDIAQRLGKLIEERMGAEVIYTRSDDTFVPLESRTALANDMKADLFLSIHANSSPAPRVAGVETFYLNISGSKDALDVAARENASSQKSIFELNDLIQKIARQDKAEESREFAGRIQTALYAFSARNVPGSRNRGVKSAPFVVLIGAKMPSVLAEIGFLSNSREESLLNKPDYRQKLADALYRGVSRYSDSLSHFQVALTPAMRASAEAKQ